MEDCMNWGGDWIQNKMNTSNYLQTIIHMYLLVTCEDWSSQMIEGASLRGDGKN